MDRRNREMKLNSRLGRVLTAAVSTVAFSLLVLAAVAPGASALTDAEELGRFGSEGSGAGQLQYPVGVAADPVTGHLYVVSDGSSSDGHGGRINEFTPWGGFVGAFGWDVAPGAVNEQQEARVRAGSGQFRLRFEGEATGDLPFDASAAEVEAALNGLSAIGGAGGSVTVSEAAGNAATSTPYVYVIVFDGALAGSDVAQIEAEDGAAPLGGGSPETSLETRTRAEGTAGGAGLEACTAESGCQAGAEGVGAGEIGTVFQLGVDAGGNLYVGESTENIFVGLHSFRIQKFSPSGRFIWALGGEVDKTTGADLCTAASGDECGGGDEGTGPSQFSRAPLVAIGPDGKVYAATGERIQRFSSDGAFEAELTVPGKTIVGFAIDQESGQLYVDYESPHPLEHRTEDGVHRLDPVTGADLGVLPIYEPVQLAARPGGGLFAVEGANEGEQDEKASGEEGERGQRVFEFDAEGRRVSILATAEFLEYDPGAGNRWFEIRGLGASPLGDLYVTYGPGGATLKGTFIRAFGPAPVSFEAPPKVAPDIVTQYVNFAAAHEAQLGAEINPRFWADTTYRLEYGLSPCSQGGCQSTSPQKLTEAPVSSPRKTGAVTIAGLDAGVTYYYRFSAESSGGGPTYGADRTFSTYPAAGTQSCPQNEAFRSGASASLPDCRAYEMVSPVQKEGGDILALGNTATGLPAIIDQSAVSGNRMTYGSYRAFGDSQSGPYTSQYVASRTGSGWLNHSVSPPRGTPLFSPGQSTADEFKLFSPDLCQGWLVSLADPPLAPGAPSGYSDAYRRTDEECGGVAYAPLSTFKPSAAGVEIELQGVSADGERAAFASTRPLSAQGTEGHVQLYAWAGGAARLACVLPGGQPYTGECTAGTTNGPGNSGTRSILSGALSSDGSRLFWTALNGADEGEIYLRENPAGSGGECGKATAPCSLAVSKAAEEAIGTEGSSTYLTAAADGSRAIFSVVEPSSHLSLYEFDVAGRATHRIAGEFLGLVGSSADASRLYLVSGEDLDGPGPAESGNRNLYYHQSGSGFSFIGALSAADVDVDNRSPVSLVPPNHLARVSPDGLRAAFVSTASPTSYDNTDQTSGEADAEVYVYDASEHALACASCNPGGARPRGTSGIPGYQTSLFTSRALSDSGGRLFFNSSDALAPADTNGSVDVYQWERPGEGGCSVGSTDFSASNRGCVALISSGKSRADSEFLDANPSGTDVFFTTLQSFVPQDPGLVDVYDARIDGGLPSPALPAPQCEGEACQGPYTPPNDPTPASSAFEGPGNVHPAKHKKKKHKKKHHNKKHHRRHAKHRRHGGKKHKGKHAKKSRRSGAGKRRGR